MSWKKTQVFFDRRGKEGRDCTEDNYAEQKNGISKRKRSHKVRNCQ